MAPQTDESVSVSVEGLECTVGGGGSELILADGERRVAFRADDGAFWTAAFRDADGVAATANGAGATFTADRTATATGAEVTLRWREEPLEFEAESGTVSTTLSGRLEDGSSAVSWSAELAVDGVAASLESVSLPAVDEVVVDSGTGGDTELVLPDGWGRCVREPLENPDDATYEARYPGARCNMQFLSVLGGDGGAYVAAHDPRGRPKSFATDPADGALGLEISHRPPGVGEPATTVSFPYPVVTATVAGDWYDAARRYRRWATAGAGWTDAGPLADRGDVPEWFLERRLWWLLAPRETDIEGDLALLERLRDAFPVPTGVHWYTWHQGPFDVDYPDYFPAREGWLEAVAALEADDVRVMPYVNARIADPNGETWRRRGLEDAAARVASARLEPVDRALAYESYGGQRMVAMCPAVSAWRETIRDVVTQLREETAASAVYLDQLGAYAPPDCVATDHGHPPGGGSYGVDGYRDLLAGIRADADETRPEFAVTTENNAEPYMDRLAGYLMWNSARDGLIPLFPAVYGDYCATFGRQFFGCDLESGAAFRSKVAQCLVFGGQLGWLSHYVAEALLEDEHETERRYLRRAVEALEGRARAITLGERLRDPAVAGVPTHTVEWEMYRHGRYDVALEAVLAGHWRVSADETALVVTNWSTVDHECRLDLERPFEGKLDLESPSDVDAALAVRGETVAVDLDVEACSTAVLSLRRVD
ncbi:DUF6259 domain-containing protein [Natrononativus amylolyticus]|uniref:DUF6259 domain-containing protein n=1 Tax=Natrononativus amylolyticus TaxID=2963434 RepID=UPI0020CBC146|nr:DUF6259 domain-containing protein [Natrononativus amylolyticus]